MHMGNSQSVERNRRASFYCGGVLKILLLHQGFLCSFSPNLLLVFTTPLLHWHIFYYTLALASDQRLQLHLY